MRAIETADLTKTYKNKTVVDHLKLTVAQGELLSLLGVNGAGKHTTIKMLTRLIRPTGGDAVLLGRSIIFHPLEVKEKINVSPQETAVAHNLTIGENFELICGIYGYSKHETKARTDESIRFFDLAQIEKDKAKTLSGGWQRWLSIAMALISQPKILFLDEPTLGLDVLARRSLWEIIRKIKGCITIVLTTHYLKEAEALSDRIEILAEGRLRALGTPAELMQRSGTARFEDAFVALCGEGGACRPLPGGRNKSVEPSSD